MQLIKNTKKLPKGSFLYILFSKITPWKDLAFFTFWISSHTMIASKKHESIMKWSEIFRRKYATCSFISLLWSFCFYNSNSIQYAMYMCIHSKIWSSLRDREKYLCSFNSNSWKLYKLFERCRRHGVVFFHKYMTSFIDIFCLIVKK